MTKDMTLHLKSDDHTEGLIEDLQVAADHDADVAIIIGGHTYYVTVDNLVVGPGRPIIEEG